MNYYIDTEFHEYKREFYIYQDNGQGEPIATEVKEVDTIELISIGIVSEDYREYYAICKEFDIEEAWNNKWLRENVLKSIAEELHLIAYADLSLFKEAINKYGKTKETIAQEIKEFTKKKEVESSISFYAYYADYDWVVFCWLFGRMIDLPKDFPMYCKDLKQDIDSLQTIVEERNQWHGSASWLDVLKSYPNYPKQNNEHNALADAKWNKELHDFIYNMY